MAFAGGGMNSSSARESAPGGRFFFFAILSVVLMYFDQRDGWGERIRYALQAVAYPIQVAVGSPRTLWHATTEMFSTRATLREQNEALQKQVRELTLRTQTFEALEQENARLRGLTAALPPVVTKSVLVDVVNADLGRLRQRVVVNKGDRAGLFRSQALIDAGGVAGQLVRVGPWSAEVMLITDPEAAVPVEVLRTGLRTIAMGTGDSSELKLPYLPAIADVKAGDIIITSGLGGVFPAGVPVGKVVENKRDPDDPLAHVRVAPAAKLDSSRQLLALWFDPSNPGAPARREQLDTLPDAAVADPVVPGMPPKTPAAAPAPTRQAPSQPGPGPHPAAVKPAARPAARSEPKAPSTPATPAPAEAQ
jgi:rod shape-determining protein MreC